MKCVPIQIIVCMWFSPALFHWIRSPFGSVSCNISKCFAVALRSQEITTFNDHLTPNIARKEFFCTGQKRNRNETKKEFICY